MPDHTKHCRVVLASPFTCDIMVSYLWCCCLNIIGCKYKKQNMIESKRLKVDKLVTAYRNQRMGGTLNFQAHSIHNKVHLV